MRFMLQIIPKRLEIIDLCVYYLRRIKITVWKPDFFLNYLIQNSSNVNTSNIKIETQFSKSLQIYVYIYTENHFNFVRL